MKQTWKDTIPLYSRRPRQGRIELSDKVESRHGNSPGISANYDIRFYATMLFVPSAPPTRHGERLWWVQDNSTRTAECRTKMNSQGNTLSIPMLRNSWTCFFSTPTVRTNSTALHTLSFLYAPVCKAKIHIMNIVAD